MAADNLGTGYQYMDLVCPEYIEHHKEGLKSGYRILN